jgi:hypothetical protein
MAFGQQSGAPASHRQMQDLMTLLEQAGHTDFRDARGPMGFTQRQAGGKFTHDEAQAFIERLEQGENEGTPSSAPAPKPKPKPAAARPTTSQAIRRLPTEQLAAELQRRGWIVVEP